LPRDSAVVSAAALDHQHRPGRVRQRWADNAEAWSLCIALLADDRITMTGQEPNGLEIRWKTFAIRHSASPKVWMDAYLAAFAFTGGFALVTTDTDFKQYQGIDLRLLIQ
jgi:predicted nucleic acid-binding protein